MRKRNNEEFDKEISWKWVVASCLCVLVLTIGCIWFIADVVKKNAIQKEYEDLSKKMQQVAVEKVDENEVEDKEAVEGEISESQAGVDESEDQDDNEEIEETEEESLEIVDPYEKIVDFDMLHGSVDSNIHAWIYIPGTKVDYPVLQHLTDNSYYLNHNLNGKEGYPGCIYTESYNSKEFQDFNTVIYGHNMKNDTMFGGLEKFLNTQYLEEHPQVYVYLPDKMNVYEIFAIYEYSDEHLLVGKNFVSSYVVKSYLDDAKVAATNSGIWNSDIVVTKDSKIITLSTCISGKDDKRLLLQAVLKE